MELNNQQSFARVIREGYGKGTVDFDSHPPGDIYEGLDEEQARAARRFNKERLAQLDADNLERQERLGQVVGVQEHLQG
jgi:hypothetical protein